MIFDKAEIEVLRLAAWCKDLPQNYAETIPAETVTLLCQIGFLRQSKSKLGYRTTPKGYTLLGQAGITYTQDKQYLGKSDALYRRLGMAELILFLYDMDADVFLESPPAKENTISFLPSFVFRRKEAANLLGGTRLAGFLYASDTTFIPYYIPSGNDGLYPLVEERTFMSKQLNRSKKTAVIYTGKKDLSELIMLTEETGEKKSKSTTKSYYESMDMFTCPVYFVPLSKMGARQLRIICQPNYIEILARHLLGNEYLSAKSDWYNALHKTTGEPFIIGIDCNLKYFDQAILKGGKPKHIVLLKDQLPAVQKRLLGKNAILHPVEAEDMETALNLPHTLRIPDRSPFQKPEGGYLYVPSFREDRKAGKKIGGRIYKT